MSLRAPYITPEAHRAATGRNLEIQTDKELYKIVPCTHAGCDTDLIVNTFYAPAKGKCSNHDGKTKTAIATSHLVHETPDARPNGALAKLLCPMCTMPMRIVNIAEDGRSITFNCSDGAGLKSRELDEARSRRLMDQGGEFCGTSVTVKPRQAWLDNRKVPTDLVKLVQDFNLDAKLRYFDANEARRGSPTA